MYLSELNQLVQYDFNKELNIPGHILFKASKEQLFTCHYIVNGILFSFYNEQEDPLMPYLYDFKQLPNLRYDDNKKDLVFDNSDLIVQIRRSFVIFYLDIFETYYNNKTLKDYILESHTQDISFFFTKRHNPIAHYIQDGSPTYKSVTERISNNV